MQEALTSALTAIAAFVPRLVLFAVILIIGIIVAKVAKKAVNKVLERVGFDRAIERGGVGKALEQSKYDPSDILAQLVYYAVLLFTLQLAFSAFGPNPISELLTSIIAFLPRVFVAIIIVVVAAAIAAAAKTLIQGSLGGLSYGKALANVAGVFILALGVIAALNQVGIATTVTTPVLIAVLATLAGVIVVGVGGGLIKPMAARWETYLTAAEAQAPKIKAEVAAAPSAAEQARTAKDHAMAAYDGAGAPSKATTGASASGPVPAGPAGNHRAHDGDDRAEARYRG